MNIAILQGNLVYEPEIQTSAKGRLYVREKIASQRPYKGKNVPREADFFVVMFFGKLAERLYNGTQKGSLITIEGRLVQKYYTDKVGNKRDEVFVIANKLTIHDYIKRDNAIKKLDMGNDDELLVPREISESIFKQIDFADEDIPDDIGGRLDDLL